MAEPLAQTAFAAGEISPELYGQVDLAKYHTALTTARNGFIGYRGGFLSRPGFALVGVCKQTLALAAGTSTGPPRNITFQFSISQGYELEFGDQYLRFAYQGGYVLENSINITGVTRANPAVVSATNTYANGDWIFIVGVGGMTQLNGNTYIVAGASGGSFQLHDLQGHPVNSTTFGTYTSGGTASRYYTVTTPYAAIDLPYLKFAQSADVMSLTCSNPITQTEYPPYDLTRLSAIDWTLVETDLDPVILPPATVSASSNGQSPSGGTNATFAYQVTAVDSKGNESIASVIATCHGANIQTQAGANTLNYARSTGAQFYNIYRAPGSVDTTGVGPNPVPAGSIFGFVGSAYGTQFVDSNPTTDISQTPPTHQNPFAPGQILAVNVTSGGSGLTAVSYTITTTNGINFVGSPLVSGGNLGGFLIYNNGEDFAPGDSIAFNGAGYASGAIAFGVTNPTAGDTITLNGVVWTFVTSITAADQTLIQGALSATLTNLASNLSASAVPALLAASYAVDSTNSNLLITYNTAGTAGNAYTLAASAATPSGTHLTGGGGMGGTAPTATLTIGPTSGTYPGVNTYFQQRHFFACSLNDPDTVWASQTGLFKNFDTAIPTVATDAITASPWTEQVNGIQWLVPMPGGLLAMTGQRAWQLVGEGSYALNVQPITPSTTQAQPEAFNGCSATIQPIIVDQDILYVESVGNTTLRDLSYNFFTSIYTGADLTLLSSHLFLYQQLVYTAWARKPYKVMWGCRDDGTMLSLTYLKEQEVYGWARHDTQGLVVSVASVTEPPVNAVYAIVQRFPPYAPQGIYTMERMDNRIWATPEDAYAVDSGVSNMFDVFADFSAIASAASGAGVTLTASGATFTSGNVGQIIRMCGGIATVTAYVDASHLTITWDLPANPGAIGLPYAAPGAWTLSNMTTALNAPHLAGMTVNVLADGVPVTGVVVGPLGAISWGFAASNVKAGLPFIAQLQTPYANGQQVAQGARKVIPAITLRLSASATGFQVGTNQPDGAAQNPPQIGPAWTNLATGNLQAPTGGQLAPPTYVSPGGQTVQGLMTGDIRITGAGAEWNSKGQVAIQQALPVSLEVTAVFPEYLEGDIPEQTYSERGSGGQSGQGGGQQSGRPPGRWMLQGSPRL